MIELGRLASSVVGRLRVVVLDDLSHCSKSCGLISKLIVRKLDKFQHLRPQWERNFLDFFVKAVAPGAPLLPGFGRSGSANVHASCARCVRRG